MIDIEPRFYVAPSLKKAAMALLFVAVGVVIGHAVAPRPTAPPHVAPRHDAFGRVVDARRAFRRPPPGPAPSAPHPVRFAPAHADPASSVRVEGLPADLPPG